LSVQKGWACLDSFWKVRGKGRANSRVHSKKKEERPPPRERKSSWRSAKSQFPGRTTGYRTLGRGGEGGRNPRKTWKEKKTGDRPHF